MFRRTHKQKNNKSKSMKGGNKCDVVPYVLTVCNKYGLSKIEQHTGYIEDKTKVALASVFTKTTPYLPQEIRKNIADYTESVIVRLQQTFAQIIYAYYFDMINDTILEEKKDKNFFENKTNFERNFGYLDCKAFINNKWEKISINYDYIYEEYIKHYDKEQLKRLHQDFL